MKDDVYTLRLCKVVSVDDDTDGWRIKARVLPEDSKTKDEDLPYAFPFLPKMFHIKPKIGEAVFIICMNANNAYSDRFYIGPIISQPQYINKDNFDYGAGRLLKGSIVEPDIAPSRNPNSNGSFPKDDEIAISGRKNTDIILSDNDIRIQSGVHLLDNTKNIVFNRQNPAYAKFKYHTTPLDNGSQSTATIVADEINLISTASDDQFKVTDKDELISQEEMNNIIEKAHLLPYGDILIEFLRLFVTAFKTHTHPYMGLPPCTDDTYMAVDNFDLNSILSKKVKIS